MMERSREWNEADLRQLIENEIEESTTLEYKAAASLGKENVQKNEIFKDVSAFANSAGGVLVYGITETDDGKPSQIDPVNPAVYTKEWLEDVITSNVQPRIDGLHINPVALAGAHEGRVVYVLTIPQGLTAHQARDRKYYKRFNFKAEPMEHYEVQDTMNRAKTPIVDLRVVCRSVQQDRNVHTYNLALTLENSGVRAANRMKVMIWFPSNLSPSVGRLIDRRAEDRQVVEGRPYQTRLLFVPYLTDALFPADILELTTIGVDITFAIDSQRHDFIERHDPRMEWIIYADDMSPRTGFLSLREVDRF